MLPSHMQHPFVDRYRDSHNASPRSLVDEETMNPPTSGNETGQNFRNKQNQNKAKMRDFLKTNMASVNCNGKYVEDGLFSPAIAVFGWHSILHP